MRIYSEFEKKQMAFAKKVVAEYQSLISDGTRAGIAKKYLASKYSCSAAKIHYTIKQFQFNN